jgi:hypothetical protein
LQSVPEYSELTKVSSVLNPMRRKGNQDVMIVELCAALTRFARSDPNGPIGFTGAANAAQLVSE